MSLFSIPEQEPIIKQLETIFNTFKASKGNIRPHFVLSGASGSGKSINIQTLSKHFKLEFLEINAAQITAEGVSGNSLSKALAPLAQMSDSLTVCFVDEFDKLFIRGQGNAELAHDSTLQVQNEFLKILESDSCSVFGDYGKYIQVNTSNVLYVFAGSFNNTKELTSSKLKNFGIRPEFLGRVNLLYSMPEISFDSYVNVLTSHPLIDQYIGLYTQFNKQEVLDKLTVQLKEVFEENVIGLRLLSSLIHNYFISNLNGK